MRDFQLYFDSLSAPELIETRFSHPLVGRGLLSVRGKTAGAFRGAATFQWTSAVRALSLLAIQGVRDGQFEPMVGGSGSLAASLDYAISKRPLWLCDMFGCQESGQPLASRLFLRTKSFA